MMNHGTQNLLYGKSVNNVEQKDNTCWLCRSESQPLLPLFSSDKSSKLHRQAIFACLDIVALYDKDANSAICSGCTEKLALFSWFSHQAKSNDLFLQQLPQELFRPGEEYCRLCLTTDGSLNKIFPTNAETRSELCAMIQECIEIEVNYYRDFEARVCKLCRSELLSIATFKQICKQSRSNTQLGYNSEEENWQNEETSNNSTSQQKRKGKKRLIEPNGKKHKPNIVENEFEQELLNVSEKNKRKEIYRMLWKADDERNFEVIKLKKGRAKISVAGFMFQISARKNGGPSIWYCDMRKLNKCKNMVTVSADGKIATFNSKIKHTHEAKIPRLLKCPPGKGSLLREDGTLESFWLLYSGTMGREFERQLVYRNYRYNLTHLNNDDTTEWLCRFKACRVTLEVSGVFKLISQIRGFHIHPELSAREIDDAFKDCKFKPNSTDVITPFREDKLQETSTKESTNLAKPQIYTILAYDDSERDFAVLRAKGNRYKILYQGYYYKYYLRAPGGLTYWKCIWDSIHNCMAMISITNDGKRASIYGQIEHNHQTKYAPIFDYDLKQYSVKNVTCDAVEQIFLLSRDCIYFSSRSLLYCHNIYNLRLVINDVETRWTCVKIDLQRKQCPAQLIIHGQFESFLQKGEHCHSPLTGQEISSVKQGNRLELSALDSDGPLSAEDNENAINSSNLLSMLKQQLFSYPAGRNSIWDKTEKKHNTFFLLTGNTRTNDYPNVVFYNDYRYAFASIDEYGTSQWICGQLLDTNMMQGTCTAHLTIEGVFQRLTFKGVHNHEKIHRPIAEFLYSSIDT
ncbi:uncharacterized protein LOC128740252 [Sabethes cyaneus]|uniref:uncharacterized protein LOC128740252 n=1 Tax=Sabethes cyaneus TaxID=53552 RepID=UPI00237ECDEC|nr:uncharacterized protein LOC128740252 [Sabethes cyaneus]